MLVCSALLPCDFLYHLRTLQRIPTRKEALSRRQVMCLDFPASRIRWWPHYDAEDGVQWLFTDEILVPYIYIIKKLHARPEQNSCPVTQRTLLNRQENVPRKKLGEAWSRQANIQALCSYPSPCLLYLENHHLVLKARPMKPCLLVNTSPVWPPPPPGLSSWALRFPYRAEMPLQTRAGSYSHGPLAPAGCLGHSNPSETVSPMNIRERKMRGVKAEGQRSQRVKQ
ncbi:PREDICTED: uncharacterized protein LOC105575166 isoform X2 [Cercocebus atys]|uniref:uncharacterized protein LOC105575166 isoform X2 n=1 Tax=Cercocebus atys TaxID=9531 RepID=UPI0005F3B26D|nr:PREDICTED: uncharacterized protein LOC105575166 isoform X2 [Cercocebus atys]